MPISSIVVAFILPHTYMSLSYCDNSVSVVRLPGYESVTTLANVPVDCHALKLGCLVIPVFERDIGLVWPGVCPYHSMFCHLFSSIALLSDITVMIVVWLSQLPEYEGADTL